MSAGAPWSWFGVRTRTGALATVVFPLAAFALNAAARHGRRQPQCAGGGTTLPRPFRKAKQDQGLLIHGAAAEIRSCELAASRGSARAHRGVCTCEAMRTIARSSALASPADDSLQEQCAMNDAPMKRGGWSWWYLLFVAQFIAVLWPPLYNRAEPSLIGLPFFYWYQLLWVIIGAVFTAIVYFATED
jgi:hypothetical protein